jgi:hypothetical protein
MIRFDIDMRKISYYKKGMVCIKWRLWLEVGGKRQEAEESVIVN